jgi:eukaryotic-like serine/threonine-protein kinase
MIEGTILHYKILEKLGEGGMGEVYKAQDTKLDRFVALKFLPSNLTAGKDEKARFVQEAKAASALNHPNVCTIHDIQEHNGQLFIVMEYIEGQTLRDRRKNLSLKQIIDIGAQTAEGLAAAHEKGIVHRDIKPENIMIRKDGIVQIMDFGLAKLRETSEVSRLTKAGTTMGTLGYMSPEQVQGLDVDYRTDIFSLGVVLYELLSGEQPFKGVHETAMMYEIVNVDPPPLSSVKEDLDSELDRIVLECLEKDREDRCQSAKELAKNLRKFKKGSTGQRTSRIYNTRQMSQIKSGQTEAAISSGSYMQSNFSSGNFIINFLNNRKLLLGTASLFFIIIVLLAVLYVTKSPNVEIPEMKSSILQPTGVTFDNQLGNNIAISPDGKFIVFVAFDSLHTEKLWLRPVNSMTAKPLTNATDEAYPFWSPENKFIAYFQQGKLMKMSIDGGPPLTICDAPNGRGGTWNSTGTIVFAPDATSGIYKVSAGGGKAEQLIKSDTTNASLSLRWPSFLPDGKHFLYSTENNATGSSASDGIYVASIDDPKPQLVLRGSSNAEYSEGYLFFVRQSILLAQPFDAGNFKLSGDSSPLTDNIQYYDVRISGSYSVSNNGILIFEQESKQNNNTVLMNDKGAILSSLFDKQVYRWASLSPNGKMITFDSYDQNERNFDIWVYDMQRSVTTKLTFDHNFDAFPTWSADGSKVVYSSQIGDHWELYAKNADGSGSPESLLSSANTNFIGLANYSQDGKYITLEADNYANKNSGADVIILPTFGDKKPIKFLTTNFNEVIASISSNDKWVTYTSDESGKYQVYVSPFNSGSKWQVSINGGISSRWIDDGKKIYYGSLDNKIMGVDVDEKGNVITFGKPYVVLDVSKIGKDVQIYDINKTGTELIAGIPNGKTAEQTFTMVTNWKAELKNGGQ